MTGGAFIHPVIDRTAGNIEFEQDIFQAKNTDRLVMGMHDIRPLINTELRPLANVDLGLDENHTHASVQVKLSSGGACSHITSPLCYFWQSLNNPASCVLGAGESDEPASHSTLEGRREVTLLRPVASQQYRASFPQIHGAEYLPTYPAMT